MTGAFLMVFWIIGARAGWWAMDRLLKRLDARAEQRALAARNITPGAR